MTDNNAVCEGPDCDNEFERIPSNKKYCGSTCKRNSENASRRRQFVNDLAAAVAPVYDVDTPDAEQHISYLRSENRRLSNALDKAKSVKFELVEAMYQASYDALSGIDFAPVKPPTQLGTSGEEEIAVTPIADLQLAKVTPTYNTEVCAARMETYADSVIALTQMQRSDHPVKDLRVWMLGDIVEGENIFGGQANLLDRSLYAQVAKDGPQILGDFLRRMLSQFETIHVVGVIGNHGQLTGRTGKRDYNSETNMDRILYKILEHIFAYEPRITFNIPDGFGESNFYAVDTIGKYRTLLVHGNQFPSPSSLYSYRTRVLGWKDGGITDTFDDVYMGHYHQPLRVSFGKTTLRISGSTESTNTYASERLATMNNASQPLQFVHPEKGVTCEHTCWL